MSNKHNEPNLMRFQLATEHLQTVVSKTVPLKDPRKAHIIPQKAKLRCLLHVLTSSFSPVLSPDTSSRSVIFQHSSSRLEFEMFRVACCVTMLHAIPSVHPAALELSIHAASADLFANDSKLLT